MTQQSSARHPGAQIKRGIVEKLDDKDPSRIRVKFGDEDGVQSFWLRVASAGAKGNRHAHGHRVGEQVACLLDWRAEDGLIVGGLYNKDHKRPEAAPESHHVQYEDGAIHEHDPKTKTHRVQMQDGKLRLQVGQGRVHVEKDKMILQIGGTRLMLTENGIVTSTPITLGSVPEVKDLEVRKK